MVAATKGQSGPYQQFLAVMAALALVLVAGITVSATVSGAARGVDAMALERQRQVLAVNHERLSAITRVAHLEAAGRALGLDGLMRLEVPPEVATRLGLAVQTANDGNAGYFAWRPDRPGTRLLMVARPGFTAAGGLLLLFAFTALWLTRTGIQRIADERARAEHLACSDQLTGLANRRVFDARIADLLRPRPAGQAPSFALLAIDLDHFKTLNDRLGHVAGDKALAEVARRLERLVPKAATLTRLGGDEFAVMVPAMGPDEALSLATRLAAAIATPYRIDTGSTARLGASIGIACAPLHGASEDDLIRRADMALYEVKENGRSFALVFDPAMEARAAARALRGAHASLSTPGQRSAIAH